MRRTCSESMGRTPSEVILSHQDWHLNTDGHRMLSEILVSALEASGLLPPAD